MATKRIIDLNEKITASDTDVLLIESEGSTNKITKANLLKDCSHNCRIDIRDYGAIGDGVANDTNAFKQAMDTIAKRGGGTVYVPKGVYSVGYFLIEANTKLLLDPEATLRARASVICSNFLVEESFPRYSGRSNITIEGGVIDANGVNVSAGTPLQFAHCKNIIIKDIRLINTVDDHSIEFVGVDGVLVDNCRFEGYINKSGASKAFKESIQIDYAGVGHGGGLSDMTPSRNVTIRNCYFGGLDETYGGFPSAIGSHGESSYLDEPMENICIENCVIEGCINAGISPYGWKNGRVHHNLIKSSGGFGIYTRYCQDVEFDFNIIEDATDGVGIYNSKNIRLDYNHVKNTLKHGIHVTEGSIDVNVIGNSLINQNLIYNIDVADATYSGIAVSSSNNIANTSEVVIINNIIKSDNNEVAYGIDIRNKAQNVLVLNNQLLAKFKGKAYRNNQVSTKYKMNRVTLYSGEVYQSGTTYNFPAGVSLSDFDEYEITVEGNGVECRTFLATELYPKIRVFNLSDSTETMSINFYEMSISMSNNEFTITSNLHQYVDFQGTTSKKSAVDGSGLKVLKVVGIRYNTQASL